jgi:hypothetical protein
MTTDVQALCDWIVDLEIMVAEADGVTAFTVRDFTEDVQAKLERMGFDVKKKRAPYRCLEIEQVEELRRSYELGQSISSLAKELGIPYSTAWSAIRGVTYKDAPGPVFPTTADKVIDQFSTPEELNDLAQETRHKGENTTIVVEIPKRVLRAFINEDIAQTVYDKFLRKLEARRSNCEVAHQPRLSDISVKIL